MIYFDNAATTRVHDDVFNAMLPFLKDEYGNPSSVYSIARRNKKAIDHSREQVAALIGADPTEIYFTGSGTESDNWAIKCICEQHQKKGKHIITSAIEHHAVLHTCQYLQKKGYEVTYLPVDSEGKVDPAAVKNAIRPDTVLITIMLANNEIGTIQPIAEIGAIAREHNILFHTDAVQAVGHIPVDVAAMNIDLLSLSGHKINCPKGIGALYMKKNVRLIPFIHGGAQERDRRAGTENVPYIVAIGKAAEIAKAEMDHECRRITELRDYMIDGILEIPHTRLNGSKTDRLPGNVNVSFEYIEGESLLLMLDMKGICASSGSACTSGSLDPSHVLLSIGLPHEIAHGSLRLTLGRYNTKHEVDTLLAELPPIVTRLREMSPLYDGQ